MSTVVGIDGTRSGWVAVRLRDRRLDAILESTHEDPARGLEGILEEIGHGAVAIGIDMPIGHEDPEGRNGGLRACDRAARVLLGARASSVFLIPPLTLFEEPSHPAAVARARKLGVPAPSAQAWAFRGKLLAVQQAARREQRLHEVHPEVSFAVMAEVQRKPAPRPRSGHGTGSTSGSASCSGRSCARRAPWAGWAVRARTTCWTPPSRRGRRTASRADSRGPCPSALPWIRRRGERLQSGREDPAASHGARRAPGRFMDVPGSRAPCSGPSFFPCCCCPGPQVPFPGEPIIPTQLEVAIESAPGLLRPLGPFVTLNVTVRYTFMEVGGSAASTEIRLAVAEAPRFLVTTLSPVAVYAPMNVPPCGCERTVEQQAFLLVSATIDAPALRAARIVVTASAQANGAYEPSEAQAAVDVTPGVFVKIDVQTPTTNFRLEPGAAAEPVLTVRNQGNGNVRVGFRLNETPPPELNASMPPPLDVGARVLGQEDEAATTLAIRTTREASGVHALTLNAEASSPEDSTAAHETTIVSFLIHVRAPPIPLGVPGLAASGVAIAILTAAIRRARGG